MALVWLVVLVGVAWPVAFGVGLLWIFLQVRALVVRCVGVLCVPQPPFFLPVRTYVDTISILS
jgi:hypothetical protein